MRAALFTIALICAALRLSAHEADSVAPRPVLNDFHIMAGSAHLADTYLTPLKYSGWSIGVGYERWQAWKDAPEQWVMHLRTDAHVDRTLNPAGNATMWNFDADIHWGMMHRWQISYGLTIGVGPSTSLNLGCLYTARNSNNPASAKAAWTIDATAYLSRSLRIGRLPVTLTWVTNLAGIGAFFSPQYGELYYEIYLGDRSGLAHCAWWGNYRRWDNRLTARLHLGSTILSIGYDCHLLSTHANNLTTRAVSHAVVVGLGGEWLSLSHSNRLKTVSPL